MGEDRKAILGNVFVEDASLASRNRRGIALKRPASVRILAIVLHQVEA